MHGGAKVTARSRIASLSAWVVFAALVSCTEGEPVPTLPTIDLSGGPAFPLEAHLESPDIAAGKYTVEELFEAGSKLFHTPFNGLDGVGIARLPDGSPLARFSVPPTGGKGGGMVSSQSCGECHNMPHAAAAGLASTNRAGDPDKDGLPPFIQRATTSLWGDGIVQLLAQEITEDLQAIRDEAAEAAGGEPGTPIERALTSKGISYGTIVATADASGTASFDLSRVEGLDPDLVVRPLGWKGGGPTVRTGMVGASAGLMGMQAEELVWFPRPGKEYHPDPDDDGVERELSVGDITAMTIYVAIQETPHSIQHLAELGLVEAPDDATVSRIEQGRAAFAQVGCESCHLPELHLANTVFEEPTTRGNGHYYNQRLAERESSYDPARPVRADLLTDAQTPRVEPHPEGGAIVRSYGDLKRHNMGRHLADPPGPQPSFSANMKPLDIDGEIVMIAPSAFLTPELWGVGSTGPWLHDARAGTLGEAVLLHGEDDPPSAGDPQRSEAQESRDAFAALSETDQEALVTFLRSLRTYSPPRDGD
jgi:mono/diheme cytochrome c family protein